VVQLDVIGTLVTLSEREPRAAAAADAGRSSTRRDLAVLLELALRRRTIVALSRAEARELAERPARLQDLWRTPRYDDEVTMGDEWPARGFPCRPLVPWRRFLINTVGGMRGYTADKEALIRRQVRGIERMLEDGRYRIDVLTQIGAVGTAPESLAFEILDDHVNHCVKDALASGSKREATAKTEQLLAAVHRFAKTR
jgi:CsoR family transcriptional regulator, copper-sensing transcriptional repressor